MGTKRQPALLKTIAYFRLMCKGIGKQCHKTSLFFEVYVGLINPNRAIDSLR